MKKLIGLTLLSLSFFSLQAQEKLNEKATTDKFNKLLYYVNNLYVDSVDAEELVEIAIVKMLEELDPHTSYIPADEVKKASEPLKGNFEGIGIRFNILKDTIFVVQTISGGPSEKIGLMANDRIVTVDGELVAGIGIQNSDVVKYLKGPKDTEVTVGVKRGKSIELLEFTITRDKIPIYSVDAAYMVAPKVGYVKVNRFSATTMDELLAALDELKKAGMNDLILDLQGNGGGYLSTAIAMVDEFLSDDKLIVYTQGRAFPKDERHAKNKGVFEKGRLMVLIDESSASASEIVSGAIQDWDRGMIVGRRSFGKGLVQRPVALPDGSELRLTMQKYYTPAGRCIQKSYEEGFDAYRNEKYDRYENGEVFSKDSIQVAESEKFYTSKGRVVYGGGGITPDVFVPLDTTGTSAYFSNLVRSGTVNNFALQYADKNKAKLLNSYPELTDFVKNYTVTDELLNELISIATEAEIEFNQEEFDISKDAITIRLKALLARSLYDGEGFYIVINDLNESLQEALRLLDSNEYKRMNLTR